VRVIGDSRVEKESYLQVQPRIGKKSQKVITAGQIALRSKTEKAGEAAKK